MRKDYLGIRRKGRELICFLIGKGQYGDEMKLEHTLYSCIS